MPKHALSIRPDRLDQLHIIAIGDALRGRTRGTFATTSEAIRVALHAAARLALEGRLLDLIKEPSPLRAKLPGCTSTNPKDTQ